MSRPTLLDVVAKLEAAHGRPKPPAHVDPWELIVLENVVYLASDDDREKAFQALRRQVGIQPKRILEADRATLRRICGSAGILADNSLQKLLDAAEVAESEFEGDVSKALDLPPAQAKRALKKFPGIGDPGAEKILLFAGRLAVLALDSNGLRVLIRLGYAPEGKGYAATYRTAQKNALSTTKPDIAGLITAYQLLRRHGQETCKRSDPLCDSCVLRSMCPVGLKLGASRR